MGTVVELVNSRDTWGGLRDGYRRAQPGVPTSTAGQVPKFRGETNTPGQPIKAPNILASAARNNQGTNVTIPYARVTPADELANKGRLNTGDVLFMQRQKLSVTAQVRMNQNQDFQYVQSVSHPHADVTRLGGLDFINRMLGSNNWQAGHTVLVNSKRPLDDWRSVRALEEWVVDGICMSNDNPHFIMSTSGDVRNDQLFNVAISGPAQINNGYSDDNHRGVAARHDLHQTLQAGRMPRQLNDGQSRASIPQGANGMYQNIASLIAGPFYDMYPEQMFDRKVKPMSELYIGLVCRKIYGKELLNYRQHIRGLENGPQDWKDATGKHFNWPQKDAEDEETGHIHIFQYIPFSDRQAWQFARVPIRDPGTGAVVRDERGSPQFELDKQIVDTTAMGAAKANPEYNLGEAEPASQRRGPMNPTRDRGDAYMPRVLKEHSNYHGENYLGIKKSELYNMVGAWRLGKVLDNRSQRKDSYTGGPVDTAFRCTLNVDIGFLDWRALRRRLELPWIGAGQFADGLDPSSEDWALAAIERGEDVYKANTYNKSKQYSQDDGTIMQWPTKYTPMPRSPAPQMDSDNLFSDNTNHPVNSTLVEAAAGPNRPNGAPSKRGLAPYKTKYQELDHHQSPDLSGQKRQRDNYHRNVDNPNYSAPANAQSADVSHARLWQEHTKEKAVQFVWNDDGLDPQTYIKQMERVGFRANTTHVIDDSEIVDEDAYMDLCALKTDLWLEAVRALAAGIENQRRGLRESFDTSGLSAHGIVPRQKMRIE